MAEKKKRSKWKIVFVVIVGIIALVILYGVGTNLNRRYNVGASGEEVSVEETLRVGHVSYEIDNTEIMETIETTDGQTLTADGGDGVFLIVDMSVDNHYFNRSTQFSYQNAHFYADGDFYSAFDPLPSSIMGGADLYELVSRERDVDAFDPYDIISKRDSREGFVIFIIHEEMLAAEDAAIYIITEGRNREEQDGYMYFNR